MTARGRAGGAGNATAPDGPRFGHRAFLHPPGQRHGTFPVPLRWLAAHRDLTGTIAQPSLIRRPKRAGRHSYQVYMTTRQDNPAEESGAAGLGGVPQPR